MFYKDTLALFWFNFSAIIRDNDYSYLSHNKDSVQDQYCTIDQYGDIYRKNPPRGWAYFPLRLFLQCLFICLFVWNGHIVIHIYNLIYKALYICLWPDSSCDAKTRSFSLLLLLYYCTLKSIFAAVLWRLSHRILLFLDISAFHDFFFDFFKGYDNSHYWNSINDLLNRQEQVSK